MTEEVSTEQVSPLTIDLKDYTRDGPEYVFDFNDFKIWRENPRLDFVAGSQRIDSVWQEKSTGKCIATVDGAPYRADPELRFQMLWQR